MLARAKTASPALAAAQLISGPDMMPLARSRERVAERARAAEASEPAEVAVRSQVAKRVVAAASLMPGSL